MGSRIRVGFHSHDEQQAMKVGAGEYFHSGQRLYRVEDADRNRALIEDCMTGELIGIEISRLLQFEPVQH